MDEILLGKMLDAGFTKEEILSIVNPKDPKPAEEPQEQQPQEEPREQQPQEEPGEQQPQEEPQEQQPPEEKPDNNMDQRLTGIEKQISTLIKAVQANNVKQDSIKTPPENLEIETDKIMESIIRPERQKKEG